MSKWIQRENLPMFKGYLDEDYYAFSIRVSKEYKEENFDNMKSIVDICQKTNLELIQMASLISHDETNNDYKKAASIIQSLIEFEYSTNKNMATVMLNIPVDVFMKRFFEILDCRKFPSILYMIGETILNNIKIQLVVSNKHITMDEQKLQRIVYNNSINIAFLGTFLCSIAISRGNIVEIHEETNGHKEFLILPKLLSVDNELVMNEAGSANEEELIELEKLLSDNVCFVIYITGSHAEESRFYNIMKSKGTIIIKCIDMRSGMSSAAIREEGIMPVVCHKRGTSAESCKKPHYECLECRTFMKFKGLFSCLLRYLKTPKSEFNVKSKSSGNDAPVLQFTDMIRCVDQYIFKGKKCKYLQKMNTYSIGQSGTGSPKCPHVRSPHLVHAKDGSVYLRSGSVIHGDVYKGYEVMGKIK